MSEEAGKNSGLKLIFLYGYRKPINYVEQSMPISESMKKGGSTEFTSPECW